MNKLLALFRRSPHAPLDELSARIDGQIDAATAERVDAHLAACDACASQLRELQAVRSALRELPEAAAPRSFRLREADVRGVRRAPAEPSAVFRLVSAMGALAAVLFVAVVAADVIDHGGSGGGAADRGVTSQSANAPRAASGLPYAATASAAAGKSEAGGPAPAPSALQPTPLEGVAAPSNDTASPADGSGGTNAPAPPSGTATAPAEDAQRVATPVTAFRAPAASSDDGPSGWRITEVAAAAVALAAGALALVMRRRTGGV